MITRKRLERLRRRAVDPDQPDHCAWAVHVIHHHIVLRVEAHFIGTKTLELARVRDWGPWAVLRALRAAERHPDLREKGKVV